MAGRAQVNTAFKVVLLVVAADYLLTRGMYTGTLLDTRLQDWPATVARLRNQITLQPPAVQYGL